MGCCIQSLLAKILAEFEIAVERDILQPLNKLSEVVMANPQLQCSIPKPLPFNLVPLFQEELPIILKRKKTLQKLISDWNAIKSRYGARCGHGRPTGLEERSRQLPSANMGSKSPKGQE